MKNKSRILIVGGSDAGLSAALRIRELDSTITPTVVLADEYPNFSICGIPFYLSHEVPDYWHLAHRTRSEIEALGIDVRTSTRAIAIDPKSKTCHLRFPNHSQQELQYDKLIIRTGAESSKPGIAGLKDDDGRRFGYDPVTVTGDYWDHKQYYPGAKRVLIRLTGDRSTGQLLGVQMAGAPETSVAKRIDTAAAALFAKESVEDINALDLSYSPPLNSPWDPLQSSAQDWSKLLAKIN